MNKKDFVAFLKEKLKNNTLPEMERDPPLIHSKDGLYWHHIDPPTPYSFDRYQPPPLYALAGDYGYWQGGSIMLNKHARRIIRGWQEGGPVDLIMDVEFPTTRFKSFVKAINCVNLSEHGGYSLEGTFLDRNQEARSATETRVSVPEEMFDGVPDDQPIVIGLSLYDQAGVAGGHVAGRVAIFGRHMKSQRAEVTFDGEVSNIRISGRIVANISQVGEIYSRSSDRKNAYYEAAKQINLMVGEWRGKMITLPSLQSEDGKTPTLNLMRKNRIMVDERIIDAPRGYWFLVDVSGLWLLGQEKGGARKIVTLDELIDDPVELSEDMLWFMEQQAKRMEALAMSYRIVVGAKNNHHKKGD